MTILDLLPGGRQARWTPDAATAYLTWRRSQDPEPTDRPDFDPLLAEAEIGRRAAVAVSLEALLMRVREAREARAWCRATGQGFETALLLTSTCAADAEILDPLGLGVSLRVALETFLGAEPPRGDPGALAAVMASLG